MTQLIKLYTLIMIGGVGFIACQSQEEIKKISIRSHSEELKGRVVSLEMKEDSTQIFLESGSITLSPPVNQWPNNLKIKVGEQVSFLTTMTIGNRSRSLIVWDKNDQIRLRVVQGAFYPLLFPETSIRYYVKPGDLIESDPNSPVVSSYLILSRIDNDEKYIVRPGGRMHLKKWVFWLIRMDRQNPNFPFPVGIAQERVLFDFDYIIYRNKVEK